MGGCCCEEVGGELTSREVEQGKNKKKKSQNTFLYQKARKCSKNDEDTSKRHRSPPEVFPLAKFGMIWALKRIMSYILWIRDCMHLIPQ